MTPGSLQKLRLVVPGIMILVAAISLVRPDLGLIEAVENSGLNDYTVAGFAVVAAGAVYMVCDVRKWLSGPYWIEIDSNIEDRLIDLIRELIGLEEPQENFLRENRRLLNIFYSVVDNDESLKTRTQTVYFNGLLVTSCVDLGVVALVFVIPHLVAGLISDCSLHFGWAICLLLTFFVSKGLLVPKAIARHKKLSNEQLELIEQQCRDRVRQLAETAMQQMPA